MVRPTEVARRPAGEVCPVDYIKDTVTMTAALLPDVGAVSPKKVRGRFFQRPALLTCACCCYCTSSCFFLTMTCSC